MKRIPPLAIVLMGTITTVFVVSHVSHGRGDPKAGPLEGTWRATSVNVKGEDVTEKAAAKLVFHNDRLKSYSAGGLSEATVTVDEKVTTFDLKLDKPQVKGSEVRGIYRIEKDTLLLSYGFDTLDRPTDFKPGKDRAVLKLERAKEKDTAPAEKEKRAGGKSVATHAK